MSFLHAMVIEAIGNLRITPLRTSLALMGVAIGCAAVVAIVQIGLIAERQILEQLENAGLNLVIVTPNLENGVVEGPADGRPFRPAEIEDSLRRLPSIRHAAMTISHSQGIYIRGETAFTNILGVTPSLLDVVDLQLEQGSFDALKMARAPVGIIGSQFPSDIDEPVTIEVGDRLRVGVDGYMITGVLAPIDYNSMIGIDFDNTLLIPNLSLNRLVEGALQWSLIIKTQPDAPKRDVEETVRTLFRDNYGLDVEFEHAETLIAAKQAQQRSLTLLLTALGAVSLIVGMVGVTNVMLASVAERRKEIGLRMAIGASPGDIKALFLIEAVVLCILGGLAGTLIGVIGSNLYASVSLADITVSYEVLAAALVMSTLTGLLAGYYPARQSSLLDPIEALQSE